MFQRKWKLMKSVIASHNFGMSERTLGEFNQNIGKRTNKSSRKTCRVVCAKVIQVKILEKKY